jgi:hypothetical protein
LARAALRSARAAATTPAASSDSSVLLFFFCKLPLSGDLSGPVEDPANTAA